MVLASRPGPDNPPDYSNFKVETVFLTEPEEDFVLVENLLLSVDPALSEVFKASQMHQPPSVILNEIRTQ